MTTAPRPAFAVRVYKATLRLYPKAFRKQFGSVMIETFVDRHNRASQSAKLNDKVRFWMWVARDLLRSVLRELFSAGFRRLDQHQTMPPKWRSGARPLHNLAPDVRYALRTMRKRPVFTLAAVLTLGLGIGATTAIFSVVNAVLLRSLPYVNSDRVVTVYQTLPSWSESPNPILRSFAFAFPVSWETYKDWLRLSESFTTLGVHMSERTYAVTGEDNPDLVTGSAVTSGVFQTLGVAPLLGRTFVPADDEVGAEPLAVLSYGYWVSRFAADSTVIGRTMMLDEVPHTVVGVMPRSFFFPAQSTGLWKTVDDRYKRPRNEGQQFWGVARLRQGVSLDLAQQQMEVVAGQIREAVPRHVYGVRLVRRREDVVGDVRPILLLLLGAVGVVLLVACANITNLLLVRASERRTEFSVRCALGASRTRVLGQLLTESLLLAMAGGVVGLSLAMVCLGPLVALLPPDVPRAGEINLDGTVLLFSSLLALGTGVLVGVVPAVGAARSRQASAFPAADRYQIGGRSRNRAQHLFVVSEIALTFVLLVGAGVLTRSMVRLSSVELGFDPSNVVTMRIGFLGARYETEELRRMLFDELRERLQALRGVRSVANSYWAPFVGGPWGGGISITGQEDPVQTNVSWNRVSPSFFETLSIRLVAGRPFGPDDYEASTGAAVISETMARFYWPGEDPIGKQFNRARDEIYTVVGVASDIRHTGRGSDLSTEPRSLVYLPDYDGLVFSAKVLGDPSTTMMAARNIFRAVDPDLPVVLASIDEEISRSLAGTRFRTLLVSLLAVLAASLASIGVYGVLSYAVTQRTREIGIRLALGATTPNVLGGVVRRGLRLIGIGLVVGLVVALNLVRLLDNLLFEISPTDPGSIIGVVALLTVVGVAASWLPARRASRVDPVEALRIE